MTAGSALLAGPVRTTITRLLDRAGMLAPARRLRLRLTLAASRDNAHLNQSDRLRFSEFSKRYGPIVGAPAPPAAAPTALVVSSRCPTIEAEICVIKSLHAAGFRAVVLLEDERRALAPFYWLAGVGEVRFWSEWISPRDFSCEARMLTERCSSADDVMKITSGGIRVGMITVCSALRRRRVGHLDWQSPEVRADVTRGLAASLAARDEARRALDAIRPQLVLTEPEYTPKGELFEQCLQQGLDVVSYDSAHRPDALMFKRYRAHNRDHHWTTLSDPSWQHLQRLDWTTSRQERLTREIDDAYTNGDWYGTRSVSVPRARIDPPEVRTRLGLDSRQTAFIFPHMLWDAPVMWGQPLFTSYQEWFVETVAAACLNTQVNWIIKIHPAHIRKQTDERYRGEPAEVCVLRDRVGTLPAHVRVLSADTPVSTLSLFPVMDYCLTVRGTVGIEAARFGIPVVTAGTARYTDRGFTIDAGSRAEYLERVGRLGDTPKLSPDQQALAERFAFGLFVARPCRLTSVAWDTSAEERGRPLVEQRARLTIQLADEWSGAADVKAMADWFVSGAEDYLNEHV